MTLARLIQTIEDADPALTCQAGCSPSPVATELDRAEVSVARRRFLFTVGRAAVTIPLIPIITGLMGVPNNPIATARRLAGRGTGIIISTVAVIAFFSTAPDIAIPAVGGETIDQTSILVGVVAIIALLPACPDDTIATTSSRAIIEALIIIVVVAIIAFLFAAYEGITAAGATALKTTVVFDIIAIVAGFSGPHDTVATTGFLATVSTGIVIDVVAIITGFIRPHMTIATSGLLTIPQAGILIVIVAIIAGFSRTDDAVTTTGPATIRQAFIVVVRIPIVAGFIISLSLKSVLTKQAVSASSQLAVACTSITVVLIPIIAGFTGVGHPVPTTAFWRYVTCVRRK